MLTYSALRCFDECPKRYAWRYQRQLEAIDKPEALVFGTIIHKVLECWFQTSDAQRALELVDRLIPNGGDRWCRARAMIDGYLDRYPTEDFEVVGVESQFSSRIHNPKTGYKSRRFDIGGKLDLLVKDQHGVWIYDHKTTRQISGQLIEKLWSDKQLLIYAKYAQEVLGHRIVGCVYDILEKPSLRRRKIKGTDEHEDDRSFYERLRAWHLDPARYHREQVYYRPQDLYYIGEDIWAATKDIMAYQKQGYWRRNTNQCLPFVGAKCDYTMLCQAHIQPDDETHLIDNHFAIRERNPEQAPEQPF